MIYYSHVNEDNSIERDLLFKSHYCQCLCLAGSGERLISLLDLKNCTDFICIDINQEALHLTQLKLTFLKHNTVSDYLKFIGHLPCSSIERIDAFSKISSHLDHECLIYWNSKKKRIEKGILNIGHFERFLSRVRPVLHLLLGKSFLKSATDKNKSLTGLTAFRWLLLKKIFEFKSIYRLFGNNDIAFVGGGADVARIAKVTNELLKTNKAKDSFIFHLIFKGSLSEMDYDMLPPSLNPEILEKTKLRLEKDNMQISYVHQDLLEYAKSLGKTISPIFISASDLLSFVSFDYVKELISLPAIKNSIIVLRSFLRNRISETDFKQIEEQGFSHFDYSSFEKSKMYQVITITRHESF